jgi:hypothetical protein
MGQEQDAIYYDNLYANSTKYRKSWKDISPRKRLWSAAADFVETQGVVDLGSGAGHFPECLFDKGKIQFYKGLDFSEKALSMARRLLDDAGIEEYIDAGPMTGSGDDRRWELSVVDLVKLASWNELAFHAFRDPETWTFTLLEILEHIEADLDVLRLVPEGSPVVISVPSFDDPAHVRHFPNQDAVRKRYGPYIDISMIRTPWKWFVVKGTKRTAHETEQIFNPTLF